MTTAAEDFLGPVGPPPHHPDIPAFLRRMPRPFRQVDEEMDELFERYGDLNRAMAIREAADLVYAITQSAWLAERIEELIKR